MSQSNYCSQPSSNTMTSFSPKHVFEFFNSIVLAPHFPPKPCAPQDTPQWSRESNCGPSATTTHDDTGFDGTGLHVWPGSRLLARFLTDPSGARRLFPQYVADPPGCAPPLHDAGNNLDGQTDDMDASSSPSSSSSGKMTPSAAAAADGRWASSTRPLHRTAAHQDYRCVAVGQRSAPPTVLELGAGTGVCGMTASLSLGCSVVLTDRRSDILDNLRRNITLNGLAARARAVRLEWGRKSRSCPAEIRELSPFKVRKHGSCVPRMKWVSQTISERRVVLDLDSPGYAWSHGFVIVSRLWRPEVFGGCVAYERVHLEARLSRVLHTPESPAGLLVS